MDSQFGIHGCHLLFQRQDPFRIDLLAKTTLELEPVTLFAFCDLRITTQVHQGLSFHTYMCNQRLDQHRWHQSSFQ